MATDVGSFKIYQLSSLLEYHRDERKKARSGTIVRSDIRTLVPGEAEGYR
jgi:hypothetical protein